MAITVDEIDEQVEEIIMMMKIWNDFYRILTTVFYSEDAADRKRLDPEFQKIKTIVAEHHAHLMTLIKKDFHIGQSVLTTVKRTISLDGFASLSSIEINKTLIEWHDANILLSETVGSLECEKDKIIRKRQDKIPTTSLSQRIKLAMNSPVVKFLVFLVVGGILFGILYMNWEAIRQNQIFIDFFKPWLEPLLKMIGMEQIVALPQGAGN
ncbi:MAG: hypothetical protein ABIH23_19940 [bacterium]